MKHRLFLSILFAAALIPAATVLLAAPELSIAAPSADQQVRAVSAPSCPAPERTHVGAELGAPDLLADPGLVPGPEAVANCKGGCNKKCKGAPNKAKCVAKCRRACDA